MAIVLTNGKHYITTNQKGGISKTLIVEDAQTFCNINIAMRKVSEDPEKCKGYYPYETEGGTCGTRKRRKYSLEERKIIYNRSDRCCALCGQTLSLKSLTLDHIVPLSLGGEDSMENLQAVCFACNQLKSNILPDAFTDRIIKIFLYQMERKSGKELKLKVIHTLLDFL